MNYYDVFGISPTASKKTINEKHRALAKKYHPDINRNEDAHEKMTMLNKAHEVLTDNEKRAEHDRELIKNRQQSSQKQTPMKQEAPRQKPAAPYISPEIIAQRRAQAEQREEKAHMMRQKAEARLKTMQAETARKMEQAKARTVEAERRNKRTNDEKDRQDVIDMLSALARKEYDLQRKTKEIDADRQNSFKVLLSLVKGNDADLLRQAEEKERKARIKEILDLVKENNGEKDEDEHVK